MKSAIIERDSLSPELKERLSEFDNQVKAYRELQEQFVNIAKETARLEITAAALEAEAEEANSSWKEMAKDGIADQRKINIEIERSVGRKSEAEKYRRTAAVRAEIHGDTLIRMAAARLELARDVKLLNQAYRGERIQQLMATDGMVEALTELFELSATAHFAEMDRMGLDSSQALRSEADERQESSEWAFSRLVAKTIRQVGGKVPPIEVANMPATVSGEIVAKGRMGLKRLKDNGGRIPNDIQARGGSQLLQRV